MSSKYIHVQEIWVYYSADSKIFTNLLPPITPGNRAKRQTIRLRGFTCETVPYTCLCSFKTWFYYWPTPITQVQLEFEHLQSVGIPNQPMFDWHPGSVENWLLHRSSAQRLRLRLRQQPKISSISSPCFPIAKSRLLTEGDLSKSLPCRILISSEIWRHSQSVKEGLLALRRNHLKLSMPSSHQGHLLSKANSHILIHRSTCKMLVWFLCHCRNCRGVKWWSKPIRHLMARAVRPSLAPQCETPWSSIQISLNWEIRTGAITSNKPAHVSLRIWVSTSLFQQSFTRCWSTRRVQCSNPIQSKWWPDDARMTSREDWLCPQQRPFCQVSLKYGVEYKNLFMITRCTWA